VSPDDNRFYSDIFNTSPIGIAVETLDGQPVFVNPALCRFLGFTEEELQGKHCVDFSPKEDAEKDWALFQQLRAGAIDHYRIDKRYFRRDDSLIWGRLSVSLLNSRPSPLVLAMIEDITEKKAAEEARFRLAAIVESSDDAIISGALDGTIVSWNAGAQRIYGYTQAEAIGKSIAILFPPERPDEENKIHETLRAGGRVEQFETVRVTKTGKRINVSLTISPVHDSSGRIVVGFSGIGRDITERKLAEESMREINRILGEKNALLQAREELLRVFVKNVPAAVAMLDRDMRYLQVSDRWCSDNSVKASEVLGRSREELPEMPERWKEFNRRALEGETLRADEDHWESGGRTRWNRWEVRPWRNPDGTIGGILVFAEDITCRKQMEEELSGMSRKLIESQEQERSRIGRELHDDINQRIAMLALQLGDLKEHPAEVDIRVQELRKELTDMANDVQALSHDLHSSKLEYLGVVAGMKSWCNEFSGRQKIEINFRSDVLGALPLDMGRTLFRLLQEALHNASKHSGVKRVDVQLREKSGEIHLIVSDTGRGFDVEAALQGVGLGLSSMRERVRLLNGAISIESKPAAGTTIRVRVPFPSKQDSHRAAI